VTTEPFAETPQPCGEHSLIGTASVTIAVVACAVGHAFDTRVNSGAIAYRRRPKAARTILIA
jgi:hypothetical protein